MNKAKKKEKGLSCIPKIFHVTLRAEPILFYFFFLVKGNKLAMKH